MKVVRLRHKGVQAQGAAFLSSADDFLPALAALYRLKPVFKRGRAGLDFVNAQGSSCNITDDTERRVVPADRRRARYREKQRCRLS